MALKRMCLDCGVFIEYGANRCEKCSNKFRGKQLNSMKAYNGRRDSEVYGFYESKEWINTREVVKVRDSYLCQLCLSDGRGKEAQLVHHIDELKESWDRRLEPMNLISLCDSCHKKVHAWYAKSKNSKAYMKSKLKEMVPQGGSF